MTNEPIWWKTGNFDFIKVPKDLFRASRYQQLTALAKLLYAFLLDRTSLSYSKGEDWMDEDGNYFVCFPLTEIMERFNCGHDKAPAILNELEQHGLIARSLKGRGRPYRIVVKPFAMEPKKQASQLLEKGSDDCGKTDRNKNKENNTDINHTDLITESKRTAIEREIKKQIAYDVLITELPPEQLDGIVRIMTDTLCDNTSSMKLMGMTLSGEIIRDRFRQLDDMHIRYVIDRLKQETDPIRNVRSYLLARLYEAPDVMAAYYELRANHDISKNTA